MMAERFHPEGSMLSALPPADRSHVQRSLEGLATELRSAVVWVTGASGFFGRNIVEGLAALDAAYDLKMHLLVSARDALRLQAATAHLPLKVSVVAGDVRALSLPISPTHVIHAATAASATLNADDPAEMISVIVDGTRHVLDLSRQAHRTVFVSSGAVYGVQPADVDHVDEESRTGPDPLQLSSAYGEGKRLAETVCAIAAASGRHVSIARCFAFVGPWLPLDTHFAIGNFMRDALAGRTIHVRGDGTPLRSYLHAADLVVWLTTILLNGRSGRAYNVGSEKSVSVAELANYIGTTYGCPVQIYGTPTGGPPPRYVPSIARASGELGLRVEIDLQDAISRTVAWHRATELRSQ